MNKLKGLKHEKLVLADTLHKKASQCLERLIYIDNRYYNINY